MVRLSRNKVMVVTMESMLAFILVWGGAELALGRLLYGVGLAVVSAALAGGASWFWMDGIEGNNTEAHP